MSDGPSLGGKNFRKKRDQMAKFVLNIGRRSYFIIFNRVGWHPLGAVWSQIQKYDAE
jgi:hypothetical protein